MSRETERQMANALYAADARGPGRRFVRQHVSPRCFASATVARVAAEPIELGDCDSRRLQSAFAVPRTPYSLRYARDKDAILDIGRRDGWEWLNDGDLAGA